MRHSLAGSEARPGGECAYPVPILRPRPPCPWYRAASGRARGPARDRDRPGHCRTPPYPRPPTRLLRQALDNRSTTTCRRCTLCVRLGDALDVLHQLAGELLPPTIEPCHGDDTLLWAPLGRGNLVTGHRRNAVTGKAFCDRALAGPSPEALNECAPCRWHWEDAELVR